MAGVTLADAEAQLAVWLAANTAVAGNQSYSIGNRSLSRTDASEIREQIDYWHTWVQKLSRTKKRVRNFVK